VTLYKTTTATAAAVVNTSSTSAANKQVFKTKVSRRLNGKCV
jgi:hypothetical protein